MTTILVTGASRGIGFEISRAFLRRGHHVIATCRDPDNAHDLQALEGVLEIHALDVGDPASIAHCADSLADRAIDILVNNAGIAYRDTRIGHLDYAAWRRVLDINLLAPVAVLEAFLPHLLRGEGRKAVAISSSLGSITRAGGGNYFYRTSKAALNMAMRSIGADLAQQGVTVAVVSPGFVDTDLTQALPVPKIPARESGDGLAAYIEAMTPEDGRRFLRFNGDELPW
ncbi:SDR family oxidoreductase [Sphingopyxis lindanitolerans]|uniref:SDR family oxidoreductase n=1 Tax=Sphingopyxis lindanitolerans TaxID=2054227 RepID=UPI0013048097|nr:SDR family oxidoreductase [Sphingopyxis lindanitolerans]